MLVITSLTFPLQTFCYHMSGENKLGGITIQKKDKALEFYEQQLGNSHQESRFQKGNPCDDQSVTSQPLISQL